MRLEFALKCLCALQLVYFYHAAAQQIPDAPRLRVNEAYVDVLVDIGAQVRLECETDAGTVDASFFRNDVEVPLPPLQGTNNGARMIASMSVMYQGRYFCRTNQSPTISTNEIAIIVPPPPLTDLRPAIAAEGENITLSCPLQTAPGLERFYSIAWRYGNMAIVRSGSDSKEPWASLNADTLALTVGPYNSSLLPSEFHCVSLSFGRPNFAKLNIAQATVGTVQVVTAKPELLRVKTSPLVVMSGNVINVTCRAEKNEQMLYNAMYQFFLNESPIGAPTNSSYIMVNATSSGNFTCNATQYSDQGTSVPSPQSAAVQAIVLDAPRLNLPDQDNDCYQKVTVTLQQPVPDEMYYAFAKTAESCTGVGQMYSVNITTSESRLEFIVNVGQSGLDTRREVYLVSWYTMNGVMGPCSNELMKPTDPSCPQECSRGFCRRKGPNAECSVPGSTGPACTGACHVTKCRACYYSKEVQNCPESCRYRCGEDPNRKCFKNWSKCVKNGFGKMAGRKRANRFKCVDPCTC